MVTSLATLGLGWSCISRLNCGNLFGSFKRAQCEIAESTHANCDIVDDKESMMSMLLGGHQKEDMVVYKSWTTACFGAILGKFVLPGANLLVWYT